MRVLSLSKALYACGHFCEVCVWMHTPTFLALGGSNHEFGLANRSHPVFAQEFDEFCQSALLVRSQMIMDMPSKIILAEIERVFRAGSDDAVQRIEPEVAGFAQLPAQRRIFNAPPQRPNRIDKRQSCQFHPRAAQIPDF